MTVTVSHDDAVALVEVDNPPVNALSRPTLEELGDAADRLAADQQIRAVVVVGAGEKAFLAGADVAEFERLLESERTIAEHIAFSNSVFDRWASLPQPVIAAVQASAVGGGLEFMLLCDFAVAAQHARFGLTEVKLGLIPGGGGTQRLARTVGVSAAKELLMLGDTVSAERARELGLLNQIVPSEEVRGRALELAHRLAALPKIAVQAAKRAVGEGLERPLADGLALERELFLKTFGSEDFRIGYRAFLEKRRPQFVHS